MIPQSRIDELLLSCVGQYRREAEMVLGTALVEHRSELAGFDDFALLEHLTSAESGRGTERGQLHRSNQRNPERINTPESAQACKASCRSLASGLTMCSGGRRSTYQAHVFSAAGAA